MVVILTKTRFDATPPHNCHVDQVGRLRSSIGTLREGTTCDRTIGGLDDLADHLPGGFLHSPKRSIDPKSVSRHLPGDDRPIAPMDER